MLEQEWLARQELQLLQCNNSAWPSGSSACVGSGGLRQPSARRGAGQASACEAAAERVQALFLEQYHANLRQYHEVVCVAGGRASWVESGVEL
jgi:hypothetical protein